MSKYATGKSAYGISDRSGFRYRLRDMRKEWNGLLVGKDEWERKEPQLDPLRATPDPQALRNPRPEQNLPEQRTIQYGFNPVGFFSIPNITPPNNLAPVGEIGTVTITGDVAPVPVEINKAYPTGMPMTASVGAAVGVGPANKAYVSGVSATALVGSVTIVSGSATASRFDSTSVKLDSTTKTFDEG